MVALGQSGVRVAVCRQAGAVVDLFIAVRCDGNSLFRYLQCAVCIVNGIAAGHVLVRRVLNHGAARNVGAAAIYGLAAGQDNAFNAVAVGQTAVVIFILCQRSAVVNLLAAGRGDGQVLRIDGQCTVHIGNVVVVGDSLVARRVLDHGAARNVVARALNGLATVHVHGCNHVAVNQRGAGIAILRQGNSVIDLALAARGNGQVSRCNAEAAVVRCHIVVRVAAQCNGNRICSDILACCPFHGVVQRLAAHCAGRGRGIGVRIIPAVNLRLALIHGHGSILRRDGKGAGCFCDHVVRGHVFVAVHHLVAVCHNVVAGYGLCNVRNGADRARHQRVALEERAGGQRNRAVAVILSVVFPAVAARRDGDRLRSVRHRQGAVRCCNAVVTGRSGGEFIAGQFVRNVSFAREGDAATHRRGDRVIAHQAGHVVTVVAVRLSVVDEFFALCGNGYCLRLNRQRAGRRRDHVVFGHVYVAVHHLKAFGDRVVAGRGIGHVRNIAGRRRRQGVAVEQRAGGHGHIIVAVCRSVVGPFVAGRGDGDLPLGLGHGQLAVRFGNGVVLCVSAGESKALQLVHRRALAREQDAAGYNRFDRGVAFNQAFHVIAVVAVLGSVVGERFALCGNGHCLRSDDEGIVDRASHHIVAGGIRRLVQGHAAEGHIIGARVGAAAAGCNSLRKGQAFNAAREAAHGLHAAVVGGRSAVRRQRHFGRFHFQRTVDDHKLNICKVAVRVREVCRLQAHVVRSGIRSLDGLVAAELEVALGVQRAADAGNGVSGNGMFAAVICLFAAVPGDRDGHLVGHRGHRQGAFNLADVVVVGLGAVFKRVSERVLAGALFRLAAGHVIGRAFAVNEPVAANGNGAVCQRLTVIDLLAVRACQRHVELSNLQLAVNDHEFNVREVGAVVPEVLRRQLHRIASGIGSRDGRVAAEGEITFCVQRIADHDVIACHGLLFSVVFFASAVFRDRNRNLVGILVHGQGAFNRCNVIVVGLGAIVQRIGKGVVAAALRGLATRHGIGRAFAVSEPVAANGNGVVLQGVTVIGLAIRRARQGDFALRNLQRAVNDDEFNVREVGAVVLEVSRFQAHLMASGVCCLNGGVAGEQDVLLGIQRVAALEGIAGNDMLFAVILRAAAVLRDRNSNLIGHRRNGQGAFGLFNVVVFGLGAVVEGVGESVRAAADILLCAGHRVGRAFLVNEPVTADGNGLVRQGFAVVNLLIVRARQRHVALPDRQCAVNNHEFNVREVLAVVREVFRLQLHVVCSGVRSLHGVATAEGNARRRVQRVADTGYSISGSGMFRAVILRTAAVLRDRNRNLLGHRRNGQGAFGLCNVVVSVLGAIFERVAESVLAAAGIRLRAGHGISRAFALHEAFAANGNGVVRQRLAVIDLLSIRARQRHVALPDLQLAVYDNELDIAEVVVLVAKVRRLQLHAVGSGVFALDRGIAVEFDVCFCILRVAARKVISGNGMFRSVVRRSTAVLGDRYGHFVSGRRYGQCARRIGNVVVSLTRGAGGRNGVFANVFARNTIDFKIVDRNAVRNAGNGERRIVCAVDLRLVFRRNHQRQRVVYRYFITILGNCDLLCRIIFIHSQVTVFIFSGNRARCDFTAVCSFSGHIVRNLDRCSLQIVMDRVSVLSCILFISSSISLVLCYVLNLGCPSIKGESLFLCRFLLGIGRFFYGRSRCAGFIFRRFFQNRGSVCINESDRIFCYIAYIEEVVVSVAVFAIVVQSVRIICANIGVLFSKRYALLRCPDADI